MINLISTWPLKKGCPKELLDTLRAMPAQVLKHEPGTLSYEIHLPASYPLGADKQAAQPPIEPVPLADMDAVIFIETYRDATAFADHLNGPLFTRFREENLHFFNEDPANPGWAVTHTQFLTAALGECSSDN